MSEVVEACALFEQPWWLDAVAPGAWQTLEVVRAGQRVARWPVVKLRRRGLLRLEMPPLTQTLGPWLDLPAPGRARLGREHELLAALIAQLPPAAGVSLHLHPTRTNLLAFHWAGFRIGVRYTYRFPAPVDHDALRAGFSQNLRRRLKRADGALGVVDDLDLSHVLDCARATFARRGEPQPYSDAMLQRLDAALALRGQRLAVGAVDAEGRILAAAYFVWDETTCYYLLGGVLSVTPDLGAHPLLMWRGLRLAAERGLAFDFEGSMLPGVERYFRSFGAEQVRYHRVVREGPALAMARLARRALRGR